MKLDGYGWTLQGEAEEFTMPEWKRQILDYLKENPSVTPIQLAQVYGLDAKTAQKNLARLMQDGTIQKTGRGLTDCQKTRNPKAMFTFWI